MSFLSEKWNDAPKPVKYFAIGVAVIFALGVVWQIFSAIGS